MYASIFFFFGGGGGFLLPLFIEKSLYSAYSKLSIATAVHVGVKKIIVLKFDFIYFLDKFVNDVLPSHIDVSISKTVAAGKYKLSEEEITYVIIYM